MKGGAVKRESYSRILRDELFTHAPASCRGTITSRQWRALVRLCQRHGAPASLSPLICGDGCLMFEAIGGLFIGCETDGYCHT